jgi:uncharacterized repeat protein (TIGR03803 family)
MKHSRCSLAVTLLAASLLAIFLATASLAANASDKVLYSFEGGDDGANPEAALIADRLGNLYGTTTDGGGAACGCGVVFELSPPARQGGDWTEAVLYRFQGPEAATPAAGLIFDQDGNLYGTTVHGGTDNDGTVFKLTPPSAPGGSWTETTLYEFRGGNDGSYPVASLVFDKAGNLYGTTLFGGGRPQVGIVFQVSPPTVPGGSWTETVLHRFGHGRRDGADPQGALLVDNRGVLYGTTMTGVVFKLIPPAPGQGQMDGTRPVPVQRLRGRERTQLHPRQEWCALWRSHPGRERQPRHDFSVGSATRRLERDHPVQLSGRQ